MTVKVSAPGKLMLMGEHAVVYGRPCIVTAVSQRMCVQASKFDEPMCEINAPDVDVVHYKKSITTIGTGEIPRGARFVEAAVKNYWEKFPFTGGVSLTTSSEFSALFGFGSSAASVVCVIKALSQLFGKNISNTQLFSLAYQTVLDVQGKGSGFDVAAAIYGGTIYFANGGKIIEPLADLDMPIVVGYTGIKADTLSLIQAVKEKMDAQPERLQRIFDAITKLTDDAKEKMLEGDWSRVGRLMEFNQEYLRDMGVSSEKLEALISAAKAAGAHGAKLSGAGGGDCMVACVPEDKRKVIEDAISAVGGQVIHIKCGAEGVRVEA